MKFIKLYFVILIGALTSCSNISDLNENTIDPVSTTPEALFSSLEKVLVDQLNSNDVYDSQMRMWTQQFQQTNFPEQSRYDQTDRQNPDHLWANLYTGVIKDAEVAKELIDNDFESNPEPIRLTNQKAIIEIMEIYAYAILVESFGDIPYTGAMDSQVADPPYDDGETVYRDLISRLSLAIDKLDSSAGSFSSSGELIYDGDVNAWIKFGNSLKLRMGIVMADVDENYSKGVIEEAYLNGVFESNDDNAGYKYSTTAPNDNPVHFMWVTEGRNTDYVAGKTFTDILNNLHDPRRSSFFNLQLQGDLGTVFHVDGNTFDYNPSGEDNPSVGDGVYIEGGDEPIYVGSIGSINDNSIELEYVSNSSPQIDDFLIFVKYEGAEIGSESSYLNWTNINDKMTIADRPGYIMSYSEIEFYLAEASARGFNVGGDVEEHYEKAISASFNEWGAPSLEDYLSRADVNYSSQIKTKEWREIIGVQLWIALYNRTFTNWMNIRRLDYPILVEPINAISGFPNRYIYPASEDNLNTEEVNKASDNIGGDEPETMLFWDKVDPMSIWNW